MALQRPYGDDYTGALPSTLESPSGRSFDDASIVLSMETQLSSLYAERSQLQTALGVSDAAEVIALVGELRAKSDRALSEPRQTPESNPLPDPLEQRIVGARRSLSSVVGAQHHCEAESRRVDGELARLESERADLEANLARVASQRTELEQARTSLHDERAQLEHRMSAVESLMEQLDHVLGASS
jgi:chromosome segregation ATPase